MVHADHAQPLHALGVLQQRVKRGARLEQARQTQQHTGAIGRANRAVGQVAIAVGERTQVRGELGNRHRVGSS